MPDAYISTVFQTSLRIGRSHSIFRTGEHLKQQADAHQLIYIASGLKAGGVHLADGLWLFNATAKLSEAYLLLVPKGAEVDMLFDAETAECLQFRFDMDALRFDLRSHAFFLEIETVINRLTNCVPLSVEELAYVRQTAEAVYRASSRADHVSRAAAGWLLSGLFARFVPDVFFSDRNSTATRFRAMIDNDPGWSRSFEQMGQALEKSPNALRVAFEKQYGMTPMRYRNARRYQVILHYLKQSELGLKQISKKLGMKNATHLAIFLKRYSGETARQIRRG